MTSQRAGFIGVGNMGGPMAKNLLRAGIPLTVCDRNQAVLAPLRESGAQVGETPRDVADNAEIVFACLAGAENSREVALGDAGIVHGKAVKIYVELSTNGVEIVHTLDRALKAKRIGFLDSPVSKEAGTKSGEVGHSVSTMTSGAKAVFEQTKPILETFAKRIFYLGEKPGLAQTAKLVNNYLSHVGRIAAFEGMLMGVKAGLEPEALLEIINGSSGRNSTTIDKFPPILSGTFKHMSNLSIVIKDMEEYLKEADKLGVPARLGPLVLNMVQDASDQGFDEGLRIFSYLERQAGVEVRGKSAKAAN